MKILFLVNDLEYFLSHRLEIALSAQKKGYNVYVYYGSKRRGDPSVLKKVNITTRKYYLNRKSINIFSDCITFVTLFFLILLSRPNLIHVISIKPYLYGGIIARLLGIKVVSSVSGLGHVAGLKSSDNLIARYIFKPVFKYAFGLLIENR